MRTERLIAATGRCLNCRHWDPEETQTGWRATIRLKPLPGEDEYGDDESLEARQRAVEARYGRCQLITLSDSYERYDEAEVPVAFCRDGSDYKANLYTRDDFGCTLWDSDASKAAT